MRHGLGHPIGAQTGLGAQTPDCIRLGLIATVDESSAGHYKSHFIDGETEAWKGGLKFPGEKQKWKGPGKG